MRNRATMVPGQPASDVTVCYRAELIWFRLGPAYAENKQQRQRKKKLITRETV